MKRIKLFFYILFLLFISINLFATEHIIIDSKQEYSNINFENYSQNIQTLGAGGVFYVTQQGILNLGPNVVFSTNYAPNIGGAIYNLNGKVNIDSTTFVSNISSGTYQSSGGAISTSGLNIASTTFISNETYASTSSYKRAYASGGAICNSTDELNIFSTIFTSNIAKGSDINGYGWGGAIQNVNNKLIISSTIFSSNTANGFGYSTSTDIGYGEGKGGALFSSDNELTILSTIFSSNTAKGDGATWYDGYGIGGAIYSYGKDGKTTISLTTFSSNKAIGVSSRYKKVYGYGGAIYSSDRQLIISSTTFISNVASGCGYFAEGDGYGGAIYCSNNKLIISSTTFNSNEVYGDSLRYNRGQGYGGAIYCSNSELTITSTIFSSNTANGLSHGYGGAIFIDSKSIATFIDDVKFIKNLAQTSGGAIYNSGTINLIANTNNLEFTGNTANGISNAIHSGGTINLWASEKGNIIFNDRITGLGIINVNNSTNTLTSIGKVILNEDMSGYTGEINLYNGEIELQAKTNENSDVNTNKFFSGNINLSSGILNILNNSIDNISINNLTTTSNANLKFDVDLSNNTSDNFMITNNAEGVLNLTAINILGINENSGQITLFNDEKSPELNILTTAIYNGYEYQFLTSNTKGILNYQYIGTDKTFKEVVNDNKTLIRSYSLSNNEIVTESLRNLGGHQLSIFGNGYDVISQDSLEGIYIGEDKVLNIENINNLCGFNTTYGAIKNEGTLNISGTNFSNNEEQDIINNGNLTLSGVSSSFEKGIIGIGTTTISGVNINLANAVIGQSKIEINNNGNLTTNASNIIADIENNSNLIFTEGINNNYVYGTGTTEIDGEVINSSTIVNAVTINENNQLRTNASDVTGDISNAGNYVLTGGENNNWIYGTGTTVIDGEVINSSTIENAVTINENNQLRTNASDVTGDISNAGNYVLTGGENNNLIYGTGTTVIDGEVINSSKIENAVIINKNKKLSTDLNYIIGIVGNILNNGTLLFNAGIANNNQITGVGTLNITADNFINNNLIEQKIVEISKESSNVSNVASSNSQQELNNFINNSTIKAENLNLKSINLKLTEEGLLSVQNLSSQNSEIDLANTVLQEHNFKTISLTDDLNLSVDADLENKKMDTISATNFSGNGKINVKAINILNDAKENKTEILFTSSTILKDKITITIDTVSSKLFKYDVNYDKYSGNFNFLLTAKTNPIIVESQVASVSGLITQNTVLNQAFSSMENIRNRIIQAKQKGLLYASTSDVIFESNNRIESGLWIRPFYSQDTISFDSLDVDNTLTGTLAGIDLVAGENSLLSFYLGYAGSNQKYEDIKLNQTGYIVGATGMIIKDKWYAGLTANINFNKAESQSDYGTDSFDLNMYSIGAKAGYNFDLSEKFVLEPNLTLMYGNVGNQEYETIQGAKIDSQSTANIIAEPQVKAKLNLTNGWQPYALLGYLINAGEKAKLVADNIAFDDMGISGYVECGLGVNKTFKNSPWSCYLQLTGKSGDISGFDGNIGIKYSFLNKKEKEDIEFIKYLKKKEKEEIKEQKKIESEKLAKQKALQEEQRRIEKEEKARIEEEERLKKEEQDRQKVLAQERIKAEKAEKEKQKLLEIERKIQENYN